MYDKVRARREALKRLWFSLPHEENKKEMKVITITTESDNWYVAKIITDTVDYYSSTSSGFRTLDEANEWVKKRQDEAKTKWNLDTEMGSRMASVYDYHNYQLIYN